MESSAAALLGIDSLVWFGGQFEASGNGAGDSDVFIQILPPEGITVHFNLDPRQEIVRCILQAPESAGWKTEDSLVSQSKVNDTVLNPSLDG